MGRKKSEHKAKVEKHSKRLWERFSDYENAVTFISSIEAWFHENWGSSGANAGHMQAFDRFPQCGDLTPDFVVRFKTPYLLVGEYMKNFRDGPGGEDDTEQILRYSQWAAETKSQASCDVMLLVGTHSDDVAAKHLRRAKRSKKKDRRPGCPVVIVGYLPDRERVNGEWYDLKWRKSAGNDRFSTPNVSADPRVQDLNALLVTNVSHCPIKVDRGALGLTARCPFINDEPPPHYTFVRVVLPAINELLTEEERDTLASGAKVDKAVTLSDILNTEVLRDMELPRERYVGKAVEWLTERGLAAKSDDANGGIVIGIDQRLLVGELVDVITEKEARSVVRSLRTPGGGRRRRGADARGQLGLFKEKVQ